MKKLIFLISSILLLSGCVVGQSINMNYQPPVQQGVGSGISVKTIVVDERPYVTSGSKEPWYIGRYRATWGNPWSVSTENKIPLANQIEHDIDVDLGSLGYTVTNTSNYDLELKVTINDWNFDAYRNGRFWYDLEVVISNQSGTDLATFTVKGEKYIKGSPLGGTKESFERIVPEVYGKIIKSITDDAKYPLYKVARNKT